MARILIIDDSDVARASLRQALEQADHEVLESSGGQSALHQLEENPDIQLIICDYNMPETDGLTLSASIKALPNFKSVPVLMLTTECVPELKDHGRKIGLSGWLIKPFSPPSLLAAIDKLVK